MSINIAGIPFKIKLVRNLKDDDGSDLYGLCDVDARVISIDAALKGKPEFNHTLFQEVNHAIWKLTGWSEKFNHSTEEGLNRALDHFLWPLLDEIQNYKP